jgi:hypothetical protein
MATKTDEQIMTDAAKDITDPSPWLRFIVVPSFRTREEAENYYRHAGTQGMGQSDY